MTAELDGDVWESQKDEAPIFRAKYTLFFESPPSPKKILHKLVKAGGGVASILKRREYILTEMSK